MLCASPLPPPGVERAGRRVGVQHPRRHPRDDGGPARVAGRSARDFAPQTVQALAAALPGFGGTENPDRSHRAGAVAAPPVRECLRIIAGDPHTEALIVQVANRGPRDVVERTGASRRGRGHDVVAGVVSFLGDTLPVQRTHTTAAAGIACARDPAEAARYSRMALSSRQSAPARCRRRVGGNVHARSCAVGGRLARRDAAA